MNPIERWKKGPGGLSCRDVAKLLQAYLDNESDPEARDRIAEHLDECVRCGLDADVFRRIKASLASRNVALEPEAMHRLRAFSQELTSGDH